MEDKIYSIFELKEGPLYVKKTFRTASRGIFFRRKGNALVQRNIYSGNGQWQLSVLAKANDTFIEVKE